MSTAVRERDTLIRSKRGEERGREGGREREGEGGERERERCSCRDGCWCKGCSVSLASSATPPIHSFSAL